MTTHVKSYPRFQHDCDACIFLGTYQWQQTAYDLYFHEMPARGEMTTPRIELIARFSDDEQEYWSSTPEVVEAGLRPVLHPITAAYHRYIALKEATP